MELLYNRQFEVDKAIILAATSRTSSYSRAFNEIARPGPFILVVRKV